MEKVLSGDAPPTREWEALETLGPRMVYAKGELIYLQGELADRFYYLQSGEVRLFLSSPDGLEKTLTICEPGHIFGEAAFFDGMPRVSCAKTLMKSAIVPVGRDALRELFSRCPDLAMTMLQYLARRVRMLSAQVDSMAFLQADKRVARLLLNLCREEPGGGCPVVKSTHEELGNLAGVSRITISRVLSSFVHSGFIATRYRLILLLDRGALEIFAFSPEEES